MTAEKLFERTFVRTVLFLAATAVLYAIIAGVTAQPYWGLVLVKSNSEIAAIARAAVSIPWLVVGLVSIFWNF